MSLTIGTTDVKICSAALALLGNSGIDSLTAENDKARACNAVYDTIVNALFSEHRWKFARKKVQLNRALAAPISEWKYQYGLPTDRMGEAYQQLFPSSALQDTPIDRYEVQGNFVLCDEEEVWADYQSKVAESEFPAYFTKLVTYCVAADIAIPTTDDTRKAAYYREIAYGKPDEGGLGGYMRTAKRLDAAGQPSYPLQRFSLIDARN